MFILSNEGLLTELGVTFDGRGNVAIDANNKSNVAKVFAAGDASYGASLVVRAIASGRKVAEDIHKSLILICYVWNSMCI